MRVTDSGLATQILGAITDGYGRLAKVQEQLATTKRINRPSDDPLGSSLVLRFQAAKASLEQYQRNADAGQQFLASTSSALAQVTEILQQANEIAVQGGNDTVSQTRGTLAVQVNQLLEELVGAGNTRFSDRYTFGGTQTATPPFSVTRDPASGQISAVAANPLGIGGTVTAEVADAVHVQTNLPGDQVFTQGVNLFDALIGLRDALAANNTADIATAMGSLTDGITQVNNAAGVVGIATQRLVALQTQNQSDLTSIEQLRSGVQDADIAELYVQLQNMQNAFQASLAAGARSIQTNLLDFLQ